MTTTNEDNHIETPPPPPPPPYDQPTPGKDASPEDATSESRWKGSLKALQEHMRAYENAKAAGDTARAARAEADITRTMHAVGDSHPDARVQEEWYARAFAFATASPGGKDHILEDMGRGLLILLAAPFALVGAVLFGAGSIVYGAGKVVTGIGNLLTWGKLKSFSRK